MPVELSLPTTIRRTPSESEPPVVPSGIMPRERPAPVKENVSKDSEAASKDKKKK